LESFTEKMPKLKTKSSCKGRFKLTARKGLSAKCSGKNHGMIKRSQQQIRDKRKRKAVSKSDAAHILKIFLGSPKKLRKVL
jgi:large subunit ribosomal protein L35